VQKDTKTVVLEIALEYVGVIITDIAEEKGGLTDLVFMAISQRT